MIVFVSVRKVSGAVMELGLVATDDNLDAISSKSWVVQPADQRSLLTLVSTMGPDELTPDTLLGQVLAGMGASMPRAAVELEEWWAEVVGTDRYSSNKPRMAAFRGYETKQALPPLIAELFAPEVIDITTLGLVRHGAVLDIVPERVSEELDDAIESLRWYKQQFQPVEISTSEDDPLLTPIPDDVREALQRVADGEDLDI